MKKNILILAIIIGLSSCKAYKDVLYVQDAGTNVQLNEQIQLQTPEATIKTGDLLIITVNTNTPEAAQPFNLPLVPGGEGMRSYGISKNSISGGAGLQNYLVDTEGYINFPVLGKLHVSGLKKTELINLIKSQIYPFYMKEEPIISIRYSNFKVSVVGEINRPGSYNVDNENYTIFEAIATAGDLTLFGRRDNILLIRQDENGKRTSVRIDLRDKNLITSPYYFLQQNDVLYIQPNDPKTRGAAFGAAETLSISVIGTLISLTSLIINILR